MLWRQHHYLRLFCNSKWKIVAYSALSVLFSFAERNSGRESRTTNKIKHRNKKNITNVARTISWCGWAICVLRVFAFCFILELMSFVLLFFCGSLLWKNVSTWFHYNFYCRVKCCTLKFYDSRIGRPVVSLINCRWLLTWMAFSAV